MLAKLVSKVKEVCTREPTENQMGWLVITVGCLVAGVSTYAFAQTRELTAAIMGGLLLSIFILTAWQFRSKLKALEDKVEKLSKKD